MQSVLIACAAVWQTVKFSLSIECIMRNIFLEKSNTEWDGETSPGPFSEKLKLGIAIWISSPKF